MRFFVYFSICISLLFFSFIVPFNIENEEHHIYTREDVDYNGRKVNYGLGYIYYDADYHLFKKIDGESFVIKGQTVQNILFSLSLYKTSENFDGIYYTVYAQNSKLGLVQIVDREEDIVIGFPAILGSY
ncbi:MAG: hypothetical protein LBH47_01105 [Christensenellaceae bacterium]|jgi:hypothetical protein|nr:hypothetical protein [Christensenellaceae bacterium]